MVGKVLRFLKWALMGIGVLAVALFGAFLMSDSNVTKGGGAAAKVAGPASAATDPASSPAPVAAAAPVPAVAPSRPASPQDAVIAYLDAVSEAGNDGRTCWDELMKSRVTQLPQPAFRMHGIMVAACAKLTDSSLQAVQALNPPQGLGQYAEVARTYHRHQVKALELRLAALGAAKLANDAPSPALSATYAAMSDSAMEHLAAMGAIGFRLADQLGRDPWNMSQRRKWP